ncbi:translation initiation factor IF-3 [Candidatus Gracilibacteria bacterium]|nr:translation initiation factor IF-3 [Candidatus Gracilibacteria bacterium]
MLQKKFVKRTNTTNFESSRGRMIFTNEQIKAPNIMIIDDEKNNLGTFPRRVALEMSDEKGLDLVQISYDPVKMLSTVRLTDYGKYMYQKGKDEKEQKKKQKPRELKELKLNYGIGDNDLQLKIRKASEFLKEKNNVKISIKLRGRENIYASKAVEKLMKIKESLSDCGKAQYETPKRETHGYSIILFSK